MAVVGLSVTFVVQSQIWLIDFTFTICSCQVFSTYSDNQMTVSIQIYGQI